MPHGRKSSAFAVAVAALTVLHPPAAAADAGPSVSLSVATTADHALRLTATSRVFVPGSRYALLIVDLTTRRPIMICTRTCTDGTTSVTTVPSADTSDASRGAHTYMAEVTEIDRTSGPDDVVASSTPVTVAAWAASVTMTDNADRTFTLRASTNYRIPGSPYSLAVIDTTTGRRIVQCSAACSDGTSISLATVPTGHSTQSSGGDHRYVAVVGSVPWPHSTPNVAATSSPVTAEAWSASLTAVPNADRTLTLRATANYRVPGSGYSLAVLDRTTGRRVVQCSGACADGVTVSLKTVPTAGTTPESAAAHRYVAVVGTVPWPYSSENVATTSSEVPVPAWEVSLTAVPDADRTLTLRAATNYRVSGSGYSLVVHDSTTGRAVVRCTATCSGGFEISVTAPVGHYVAVVSDAVPSRASVNVAATSSG